MPTASCSTLATGARQLVVQDALEMTSWRVGVVGLVEVDAEDDGDVARARALGRRRDDHLASARLEVPRGLVARAEAAGRLDHDVDAERRPTAARRVGLGE